MCHRSLKSIFFLILFLNNQFAFAELMIHRWDKVPNADYYQGQLRVSGNTYNIRTRDLWLLLPDDAELSLEAYSGSHKIAPVVSSATPTPRQNLLVNRKNNSARTQVEVKTPSVAKSNLTAEELAELEADYPEELGLEEARFEKARAEEVRPEENSSVSFDETTASYEQGSPQADLATPHDTKLKATVWTGIGKESVDFTSQTQNFSGSSLAQYFGVGADAQLSTKLRVFFQAYFNSLKIKNSESEELEGSETTQEETSYSIQHLHKDFRFGFLSSIFDFNSQSNLSLGLAMQYSNLPLLKEVIESSKVKIQSESFYPFYVLAAFKKNWEKLFFEIEASMAVWAQSAESYNHLTVEPKICWKFSPKIEAYTSFMFNDRTIDYKAQCLLDTCSSRTTNNKISVNALLFGLSLNY